MASSPARRHLTRVTRRCVTHKVGFRTYLQALDAAERLMEQGRVHPGCHITPYRCADCGEWHVYNRIIVWTGGRV